MVDLVFEEACGGHTLARHVGKSEAWLRDRLTQGPVPHAASSFVSYAEAVAAVDAVIEASGATIGEWLRQDADLRLILLHRVNPPVGRLVRRDTLMRLLRQEFALC